MKVDPNHAVEIQQEFVLCESGIIQCNDGSKTPFNEVDNPASAFHAFCKTLDPNKCFIIVLIPREEDRELFFRAREAARRYSIHVQAPVETPERIREMWGNYLQLKANQKFGSSE